VKKSLKIKDATLDDTGIYMCKGTNGFGSQDSRIDLIVIGKTADVDIVDLVIHGVFLSKI
jgi:hypothetical protein